jgi:hypothetical protein
MLMELQYTKTLKAASDSQELTFDTEVTGMRSAIPFKRMMNVVRLLNAAWFLRRQSTRLADEEVMKV